MAATPKRNLRIPDELWAAAQDKAVERGESVTAAIVQFLTEYAEYTPPPKAPAQTLAAIKRRETEQRLARLDRL